MGAGVSKDGRDLLDAARRGDACAVESALKEAGPRIAGASTLLQRRGVLHIAARQGQPEVIRAVIEPLLAATRAELASARAAGVGDAQLASSPGPALHALRRAVNVRDSAGRTPLHLAAKRGHLACVRELARSCATNVFVSDHAGCTCLHAAALRGHHDIIQYILDLMTTADAARRARLVNRRNLSGFSALSYAAWSGCAPAVRLLLAQGADAYAVNEHVFDQFLPLPLGSTPLHIAASRGHAAAALALLEHYALQRLESAAPRRRPLHDPRSLLNVHGHTPAAVAGQHGGGGAAAALVVPGVPIGRIVDVAALTSRRGPAALKELAAHAWRGALLAQIDTLDALATSACGISCLDPAGAAAAARAGGAAVGPRGGCSDGRAGRGACPRCAEIEAASSEAQREEEEEEEERGEGPASGNWYFGSAITSVTSVTSVTSITGSVTGVTAVAGDGSDPGAPPARGLSRAVSLGGDSCSSGCWGAGGAGGDCCPSPRASGAGRRADCAEQPCCCERVPPAPAARRLGFSEARGPGGFAPGDSSDDDDDDEEEEACGICFEPLGAAATMRACGHRLCTACARGVVERQAVATAVPTCPFCRGVIQGFVGV